MIIALKLLLSFAFLRVTSYCFYFNNYLNYEYCISLCTLFHVFIKGKISKYIFEQYNAKCTMKYVSFSCCNVIKWSHSQHPEVRPGPKTLPHEHAHAHTHTPIHLMVKVTLETSRVLPRTRKLMSHKSGQRFQNKQCHQCALEFHTHPQTSIYMCKKQTLMSLIFSVINSPVSI